MVERPHSIRGGPGSIPGRCSSIFGIWREVLGHKHTHIMCRFHSSMVERPHSIRGARVWFPDDAVQYLAFGEKYWDICTPIFMYRFQSSMVERPHSIRGGPGSIPGRCSSIFGIWRELLGRNVYITSQYFFPAIIYRDIISHITITYWYIMYFFRTFKKSTAPYKVRNMGLRYIKNRGGLGEAWSWEHWTPGFNCRPVLTSLVGKTCIQKGLGNISAVSEV